jgi:hypothetical protein
MKTLKKKKKRTQSEKVQSINSDPEGETMPQI